MVRDVLLRYLVLPPFAAEAIALWIAHTYLMDCSGFTPYLHISSPVRECGKTTLLELAFHLAHRAQFTSGMSAAAMYRPRGRAPTHTP